MRYQEIANRITGFGLPVGSISWNPPKLEKDIAYEVITFLEDRRVLYNPDELEVPEHCRESVLKIREFLTEKLAEVNNESKLRVVLQGMRAACRKFLDTETHNSTRDRRLLRYDMSMIEQFSFDSGIGALRATNWDAACFTFSVI